MGLGFTERTEHNVGRGERAEQSRGACMEIKGRGLLGICYPDFGNGVVRYVQLTSSG